MPESTASGKGKGKAMNKKIMIFALVIGTILSGMNAEARPGPRGRGPAPRHAVRHHRPAPRPAVHHHHHHRGKWYNGGLGFAAGVIGAGLVAGTVNAICAPRYYEPVYRTTTPVIIEQPAPVVVQQPTVVLPQSTVVAPSTGQRVWVEGHWKVEHDAGGNVIRRTWVEGYWQTVQ
jgi:hypothetical protein